MGNALAKSIEDKFIDYERKLAEAKRRSESLKGELESTLRSKQKLNKKILEAENRASQSFSENKQLTEINFQLKSKLDESQRLLNSTISEKELIATKLVSDEATLVEIETNLREAIGRLDRRDLEAQDLLQKLNDLESKIKLFEEKARETLDEIENRNAELEGTLLKLKHLRVSLQTLPIDNKMIENQIKVYGKRLVGSEVAGEATFPLKGESDSTLTELASLTRTNKELSKKFLGAESKTSQSFEENKQSIGTNDELKNKTDELLKLLNPAASEKEVATTQALPEISISGELKSQHSRFIDLHPAAESRTVEAENKLQEAIERFTRRDKEAEDLLEKVNVLENQIKLYEEKARETSDELERRNAELDSTLRAKQELSKKILETESKASQYFSENEQFIDENVQLKSKLDESQELLRSAVSEKEIITTKLVSAEASIAEVETQLREAIERFNQRDLEAEDSLQKVNALENQMKLCEEKARETADELERRNAELEPIFSKLNHLETFVTELQGKSAHFENESKNLVEANKKLTEEVSIYESQLNDFEAKYTAALVENEETTAQLQASKTTIEDLTQQHLHQEEKLQAQISYFVDENNMLNELHQNTKKDLQQVISQLQKQLGGHKARENALISELRNCKAEIAQKSLPQKSIIQVKRKKQLAARRQTEPGEASRSNARRF